MSNLSPQEWLEVDLKLALRATQTEPGLSLLQIARIMREVLPYDYLQLLAQEITKYEDKKTRGEAEGSAEQVAS